MPLHLAPRLLALGLALSLTACVSTSRDLHPQFTAAFVGKSVSNATAVLGSPAASTATASGETLTWSNARSGTRRVPIQSYINSAWVTRGYRNEGYTVSCTYRANVEGGTIVSDELTGDPGMCEGLLGR